MRKINLDEPKITLRLAPALKQRAAQIAAARGIVNDELKKKALTIEIIRVIIQEELKRALKPSCFHLL